MTDFTKMLADIALLQKEVSDLKTKKGTIKELTAPTPVATAPAAVPAPIAASDKAEKVYTRKDFDSEKSALQQKIKSFAEAQKITLDKSYQDILVLKDMSKVKLKHLDAILTQVNEKALAMQDAEKKATAPAKAPVAVTPAKAPVAAAPTKAPVAPAPVATAPSVSVADAESMLKTVNTLLTDVTQLKARKDAPQYDEVKYAADKLALRDKINTAVVAMSAVKLTDDMKNVLNPKSDAKVKLDSKTGLSLKDILDNVQTQLTVLKQAAVAEAAKKPVEPKPTDDAAKKEAEAKAKQQADALALLAKTQKEAAAAAAEKEALSKRTNAMTSFDKLVNELNAKTQVFGAAQMKELKVDQLGKDLKALSAQFIATPSMTNKDFKAGYDKIMTPAVQAALAKQPVLKQLLADLAFIVASILTLGAIPVITRIATRDTTKSFRPEFFKLAPTAAEVTAKEVNTNVTTMAMG